MKRLLLLLIAAPTSWWGYRKLRSHPVTTRTLSEIEGQSQRIFNQASNALRSAKKQAASKTAEIADAAAAGVQGAIDTASGKAHGGLDGAAHKARQAVSPVHENVSEVRGEGSATMPKPTPAGKTPAP